MCSIVGSFSKDKFKELITLNQSRGSFSYSFLVLDTKTLQTKSLIQDFGIFSLDIIDTAEDGMFYLGHTQAPTGGLLKDRDRIHPAITNNNFLFHNGIIKHKDIIRLKSDLKSDLNWDSKLMLLEIESKGLNISLNTIDGSFACVYNDETSVRLFRSAAGTLFVDNELNISSTKFDGVNRIETDTIFTVDFETRQLIKTDSFKSKSAPYFY